MVALLLLAGPVQAAPLELQLSGDLRLADATFAAGNLEAAGLGLDDPLLTGVAAMTAEGELTVCPIDTRPGLVPEVVRLLTSDCDGGQTFEQAELRGSPGTDVRFPHAFSDVALSEATLTFWTSDRMLVSLSRGLSFGGDEDVRWSAVNDEASHTVVDDEGELHHFNGTDFAFLWETDRVTVDADAVSGQPDVRSFVLRAADARAMDVAFDPFRFLRQERYLLGPAEVEPRANVTPLLLEFGRLTSLVNGGFVGQLQGMAGDLELRGEPALVRGGVTTFTVGQAIAGDLEVQAAVVGRDVAIRDGDASGPPFTLIAALWIVALAVALLRRTPGVHHGATRWIRLASLVAAWVVVEFWLLARVFGSGLVAEAQAGAPLSTMVAVAALEGLVVVLAYLGFAVPLNILATRLFPGAGPDPDAEPAVDEQGRRLRRRARPEVAKGRTVQWIAQLAAGGSWIVVIMACSAPLLSLALRFVRL